MNPQLVYMITQQRIVRISPRGPALAGRAGASVGP